MSGCILKLFVLVFNLTQRIFRMLCLSVISERIIKYFLSLNSKCHINNTVNLLESVDGLVKFGN